MTGELIAHGPPPRHRCAPGITYRPFGALQIIEHPTPWSHPKGTVWLCRKCGRTWVSLGAIYRNAPGRCDWRPIGRLGLWWLRRRARRGRA